MWEGFAYEGFRVGKTAKNNTSNKSDDDDKQLRAVARRLAGAVIRMWKDPEKQQEYCRNARKHARRTHRRELNYMKLMEIYAKILA